jgi:hypothetical protein
MLLKWERSGPKESFDVVDSMTVQVPNASLMEEISVGYNQFMRISLPFQQLLSPGYASLR